MIRSALKDYPLTLRHNAAAWRLAQTLFDCRCEAYAFAPCPWDDLPYEHRMFYMQKAVEFLNQIKTVPPLADPGIRIVVRDGERA